MRDVMVYVYISESYVTGHGAQRSFRTRIDTRGYLRNVVHEGSKWLHRLHTEVVELTH